MENLFAFQLEKLPVKGTKAEKIPDTYEEFFLDDRKSFRCTMPDCGKIFRFKSEIMRHSVIHFNKRPYDCTHPGCKKTFKRADALDNHMKVHSQNLPFECDFEGCGQKFATKATLKYHLLKHNNERAYHCSLPGCNKSFFTLSQLKQHEKAYNCHSKFVNQEEEPVKMTKIQKKDEFEQFMAPPPRILQEMEWEIRNQDEDVPEASENLIKYFLSDNVSEPNLEVSSPFKQVEPAIFQMDNEPLLQPMNEPSVFFNDSELKFLDFLKEIDTNDF